VKPKGFLSLELLLIVAALAAVGGSIWWLSGLRVSKLQAEYEATNATARAQRREDISDLQVKLSAAQQSLADERTHAEAARLDQQRERKGRLNEFVPKNSSPAACVTVGWVRYTNAAAAGVPLGVRPGPGVAQAPSGVGTDTTADTVARNYDKYAGCKATVAGILKEFDTKRTEENTVIDRINQRIQRAERKVQ
jgi:type II secretory pathway pseudopilin PulG